MRPGCQKGDPRVGAQPGPVRRCSDAVRVVPNSDLGMPLAANYRREATADARSCRRQRALQQPGSGSPLCQEVSRGGLFPADEGAPVLAGVKLKRALDTGCGRRWDRPSGTARRTLRALGWDGCSLRCGGSGK